MRAIKRARRTEATTAAIAGGLAIAGIGGGLLLWWLLSRQQGIQGQPTARFIVRR